MKFIIMFMQLLSVVMTVMRDVEAAAPGKGLGSQKKLLVLEFTEEAYKALGGTAADWPTMRERLDKAIDATAKFFNSADVFTKK